eukprot:TRINITY_DN67256_c0_g1_i1.p1 TRINITY_DN67256_c0_g1~~TRINITY_DN67256_c0_g1_i1.p1  ORF type:complete len:874 (-),score=115.09 TRINITY_DN67256_c0_g1_i1:225-2756(-)
MSAAPGSGFIVRSWGSDSDDPVIHTLTGTFALSGFNHERKVYKKEPIEDEAESSDVFIYFWEDKACPLLTGWWFGSAVGGDGTWAFCASFADCPPVSGWKIPYDGPVRESLVVTSAELERHKEKALPSLPKLQRVNISLLGGDTVLPGIGKSDVASALLRGLTSDWPGDSDPVFEMAYDNGVFDNVWTDMLKEDPAGEPNSDRWGIGPLGAWCRLDRVQFEEKSDSKVAQPYKAAATQGFAPLFAGSPEKLNVGHSKSTGSNRAFREALITGGSDPNLFENVHKLMYAAAKASPREVVRRFRPCVGVLASFARFAPEVSNHMGCSAVILDVFDTSFRPHGCDNNIGLLYAAVPNGRVHQGLASGDFVCSIRGAGSNIARLVREYNWLASGGASGGPEQAARERLDWWKADLRSTVEFYLSKTNLTNDPHCLERRALNFRGWLDLEVLMGRGRIAAAGVSDEKTLCQILQDSPTLEAKVGDDGRYRVRPHGYEPGALGPMPAPKRNGEPVAPIDPKKQRTDGTPAGKAPGVAADAPKTDVPKDPVQEALAKAKAQDPICWQFAKGQCQKGDACRYMHVVRTNFSAPGAVLTPAMRLAGAMAMGSFGAGGIVPGFATGGTVPPHLAAMLGVGQKPPDTAEAKAQPESAKATEASPEPKPEEPTQVQTSSVSGGNSEPAVSANRPTLHPGTRVLIQGLSKAASFNNRFALCRSFDEASGRWDVRLEDGAALRVKEVNLRAMDGDARSSPKPTDEDPPEDVTEDPSEQAPRQARSFATAAAEREQAKEEGPNLAPGARVVIQGLVSKPAFNNRIGVCRSFDFIAGRWHVALSDGSSLRVKDTNLRVC